MSSPSQSLGRLPGPGLECATQAMLYTSFMSDGGGALAKTLAVMPLVVKLWKLQVIVPSLHLIRPLDCIVGCSAETVMNAWETTRDRPRTPIICYE